jgi:hypothetical protein
MMIATTSIARTMADALDPVGLAERVGLRPDAWQAEILRTSAPRILITAGRQIGKSTVSSIMAVHTALYRPKSLTLVVSPSLKQSQESFRLMLTAYKTLGRPVPSEAENTLSVVLENGSRIVALPGAETVRGYAAAALVVVDEAARVPDELYFAIRPMLAVSGGKLVVMSTPAGRRGWFYQAHEHESDWKKWRIPASKCPRISAAFLAEEKRTLGAAVFGQEYECIFTDSNDAVFLSDVVDSAFSSDIKPLFAKEE